MVQSFKFIKQPLNIFDSTSFETSFIKMKETLNWLLFLKKRPILYSIVKSNLCIVKNNILLNPTKTFFLILSLFFSPFFFLSFPFFSPFPSTSCPEEDQILIFSSPNYKMAAHSVEGYRIWRSTEQ